MASFVDTHAHIDTAAFDDDREAVIERARAAGVEHIILAGAARTADDIERTIRAARTAEYLHATCGVHPHEAKHLDDALFAALETWSAEPDVLAIGETGLDYHYDHSPRDVQRAAFVRQLGLARDRRLPVICHIRDAHEDAIAILTEHAGGAPLAGVIHCFTGGPEDGARYVDLGLHLSFSGILTFGAAAEPVREAARQAPADRLLLETDAPYLAPVPERGQRNEPAFLVHTAARLATLRGLPLDELAVQTTQNARNLFGFDV